MLNKFGGVFEALETIDGGFELNRTAKAWLGPGRPLGAAFDAQGNMIICDALKVVLYCCPTRAATELHDALIASHVMFTCCLPHTPLAAATEAMNAKPPAWQQQFAC